MEEQDVKRIIESEARKAQYGVTRVPVHTHNNLDSPPISFKNITNKTFTVSSVVPGTSAATAGNYGPFWIADAQCFIRTMYQSHAANGTDGSAVTLFIEILTPGQVSGSGTSVVGFNMKTGANQIGSSTLILGGTPAILSQFDRLSLFMSGTPTSVNDVTVTVLLEYL